MNITKHLDLLGHKAEDKITGFSGIIDSISFDLYGCIQVTIRPPMDTKGDIPDGRWFDITRIEIKSKKPIMNVPSFETIPGPAKKSK